MFNAIAERYDFVNYFISLGRHKAWRRRMLACLPSRFQQKVLDLATGTGDVAFEVALSPRVDEVYGLDLSTSMLDVARRKLSGFGEQKKISFGYGDALDTRCDPDSFDAVTMSFGIRNVREPISCLKECYRVLNDGGRVIILESGRPDSAMMAFFNRIYVKNVMPLLGRLLSGHKNAYSYLNETVLEFPSGNGFLTLMREAGFKDLKRESFLFGSVQLYRGTK